MATKARSPILPRNPKDPTGVDKLERGAIRDFTRRMRKVNRAYQVALKRIPADPITANQSSAEVTKYAYRLDQYLLAAIMAGLDTEVSAILLEGGERGLWFFDAYVDVASARGTAQSFANLAQQSDAYRSGRGSVAQIVASDPYQRRMALVRSRVFEDIKGLTQTTKTEMARVLTEGIGRGQNPRQIARNLTDRAGIEARRGHKIARTEIPTALRRARMDEADDATELYGLRTMELYLSALSATTRASHAARHGRMYTTDQLRDWWSGAESINCKCSASSVMVDENGQPLVPAIVARAKQTKQVMEKRDYAWSKPKKTPSRAAR